MAFGESGVSAKSIKDAAISVAITILIIKVQVQWSVQWKKVS